ncbi:hypothetical protein C8R45DRAFT_1156875 [Mycena sanguinolenta]|nr:hypothetical protein C8R45DRAFT_1156875 [Mycena sanguinolenta]
MSTTQITRPASKKAGVVHRRAETPARAQTDVNGMPGLRWCSVPWAHFRWACIHYRPLKLGMGNDSAYADGFERRSCTVDDAWMAQASSSACTTAVPSYHGNVMLFIVLASWRSSSSRPGPEHWGGDSCKGQFSGVLMKACWSRPSRWSTTAFLGSLHVHVIWRDLEYGEALYLSKSPPFSSHIPPCSRRQQSPDPTRTSYFATPDRIYGHVSRILSAPSAQSALGTTFFLPHRTTTAACSWGGTFGRPASRCCYVGALPSFFPGPQILTLRASYFLELPSHRSQNADLVLDDEDLGADGALRAQNRPADNEEQVGRAGVVHQSCDDFEASPNRCSADA